MLKTIQNTIKNLWQPCGNQSQQQQQAWLFDLTETQTLTIVKKKMLLEIKSTFT